MGIFDSIKSHAERAIKDTTKGEEQTRAPEDLEAHAKKVAESIDADVRCVNILWDCVLVAMPSETFDRALLGETPCELCPIHEIEYRVSRTHFIRRDSLP